MKTAFTLKEKKMLKKSGIPDHVCVYICIKMCTFIQVHMLLLLCISMFLLKQQMPEPFRKVMGFFVALCIIPAIASSTAVCKTFIANEELETRKWIAQVKFGKAAAGKTIFLFVN